MSSHSEVQDSLLEQSKEQARDKEGEGRRSYWASVAPCGKAKSFLDPRVADTAAPARPTWPSLALVFSGVGWACSHIVIICLRPILETHWSPFIHSFIHSTQHMPCWTLGSLCVMRWSVHEDLPALAEEREEQIEHCDLRARGEAGVAGGHPRWRAALWGKARK